MRAGLDLLPAPEANTEPERHRETTEPRSFRFQLPFGVKEELFTVLPPNAANGKPDGSIYPTVTDGNDRQGDKD